MRENRPTAIDTVLWAGQWALASAFLVTGLLKLCLEPGELQLIGLATAAPARLLRPVGGVEVAAALAVILPSTTRVLPRLSPLAAAALAAVSLLGAALPSSGGGLGLLPGDLALAAVAAFVAWGRLAKASLEPLRLEPPDGSADDAARAQVERARARVRSAFGRRPSKDVQPPPEPAVPARPGQAPARPTSLEARTRGGRVAAADSPQVRLSAGR